MKHGEHSARSASGWLWLGLALSIGLAACDQAGGGPLGPVETRVEPPASVRAEYQWVLHGWERDGVRPIGGPAVELSWELPRNWEGEPFRIYGKRSTDSDYSLAATVTACARSACQYTDLNVAPGAIYDYYVATADEGAQQESRSAVVRVAVPATTTPAAPGTPRVTGLDGAVYLQWQSTGAERYRVFLERVGPDAVFYEIGETDGTGFLDERAENGVRYAYRIAAVDTLGHLSARSELGSGIPRPDYHSELIWTAADSLAASGFRFQSSEGESPIVGGSASTAQWRLDTVDGVVSIRPLGQTLVTRGDFTTALTCGPGSEADCVSVDTAPALAQFSSSAAPVQAGSTYVFRVVGDDGRTHHGKIRVQGLTTDRDGRRVAVLDWAYQLQPDSPSLSTAPAGR